jgi:hypothetical protein
MAANQSYAESVATARQICAQNKSWRRSPKRLFYRLLIGVFGGFWFINGLVGGGLPLWWFFQFYYSWARHHVFLVGVLTFFIDLILLAPLGYAYSKEQDARQSEFLDAYRQVTAGDG